jgi:phospholipid/cholesterol/gamma-HCH transport system substrate-binding protein
MDLLLKNINAGKGSLGQLAVNPALYNNANTTLAQGGSLVTELRKNPKKYLTVHVKLF